MPYFGLRHSPFSVASHVEQKRIEVTLAVGDKHFPGIFGVPHFFDVKWLRNLTTITAKNLVKLIRSKRSPFYLYISYLCRVLKKNHSCMVDVGLKLSGLTAGTKWARAIPHFRGFRRFGGGGGVALATPITHPILQPQDAWAIEH